MQTSTCSLTLLLYLSAQVLWSSTVQEARGNEKDMLAGLKIQSLRHGSVRCSIRFVCPPVPFAPMSAQCWMLFRRPKHRRTTC